MSRPSNGDGYIPLPTHISASASSSTTNKKYIPSVSLTSRILELVRSGCLAALVGLHTYGVISVAGRGEHGNRRGGKGRGIWLTFRAELSVEAVFLGVYTILLLHSLYLTFKSRSTTTRRIASVLLNTLTFLAALFFFHRDVYPLATYAQHPTDPIYLPSAIAWTRIALVGTAGFLIPLIQPRIYNPVDPAYPSESPHPRQTVSIFSRMFFSYMDSIILYAWRNPQIEYKDLPAAPDTDRAAHLFADVIPNLDPFERKRKGLKQRSILTLILVKFWSVYSSMALMMFLKAALEFASPIALNELLRSLQMDAEPSTYRPWVWVVLLGAGPLASSITMAYYQVLATTNLVRLECVFSELLFTHALRIKMQDSPSSAADAAATAVGTPPIQSEEGDLMLKGEDLGEANNLDEARPQDGSSSSSSSDGDRTKINEGAATPTTTAAKPQDPAKEKEASVVGRINTLMTADIDNVLEGREILTLLIYSPIQIIIGTIFLYQILSWSALVAMAVSIATLPIPGYLSTILQKVQKDLMKATDHRVQAVTEVLSTIRMVKLFAWEPKVKEQLSEKRDNELRQLKRRQLWGTAVGGVAWMLPVLTMVVCYGLYTVVEGKALTAAKVFSSLTVFDMVRGQMYQITQQIQTLITAKVSLERLDTFLSHTEMLDRYENDAVSEEETEAAQSKGVYFKNASFHWESAAKRVAGQRQFHLKIDDVTFPDGQITIIAGPTGCGKSSMLMALLGELAFEATGSDSSFNLPRAGRVAYAAQESWVMADTVRENILFGTPYDEERYKMVIDQCALETDLALFAAGDETELGEKGLNASGGQKARISLARAFYSKAAIVLLDDVLSALDVHTTQYIIDHLLKGPLAEGRTIILVTHHVSLCSQVADYIVNMSINGTVLSQGTVDKSQYLQSETVAATLPVTTEGESSAEALVEAAEGEQAPAKDSGNEGKLVVAEEKNTGRVSRRALWEYFTSAGGPFFWSIYWLDITAGEFLFAFCNYWLGLWSKAYDQASNPRDVSTVYWMGIYVFLMFLQIGSYNSTSIMWMLGAQRAARLLHARLVSSILSAPMRFLDQTPTGRLVGRFTKDIGGVDNRFVRMFQGVSEIIVTMLMKFVLLMWLVPVFAPYALLTGIVGLVIGEIYIKAQLSIKREMSNSKTPLYTHFAAASNGLVSIRAFDAEERFKTQLGDKADAYTGTAITLWDVNRWVGIRIDILGALFASVLSAALVYLSNDLEVFVLGFAINQAVSFAEILLHAVRMLNEFEVQANGIERIHDYINIEHEPAPTERGKPPASWPTDGKITMDGLSARYYEGGPVVLKELSLTVESGARVGIVGRTGSGKSTLTLALLRMIPTEGTCTISGMDISKVNLESIRSHITIIPQDPVLLSGSLRFNLDPFDTEDDATLNDALDVSGLTSARLQGTAAGAATMAINLDTNISSGGGNLSQGQRQLVSLARALVRGSKILILDEATASVDFATDALVQKAIRNLHGITILTVAHRLSSVMDYEKILVLGAGEVLEYDSPYELLQRKDGQLRAMVDKATNKVELEGLAEPKEKP